MMKKTYMQKTAEVTREWHQFDAAGVVLGRMATQIAILLMGKQKPTYTPHIDSGDYVVIINAEKVEVTRNKAATKMYRRHSGFMGGLKETTFAQMQKDKPEEIIRLAVRTMLPDNKLRGPRMTRLKIFVGSEHPHKTHFTKEA